MITQNEINEISALFPTTCPAYYLYPDGDIKNNVPCVVFKLAQEENKDPVHTVTVTAELFCSRATLVANGQLVHNAIYTPDIRVSNVSWRDVSYFSDIDLVERSFTFNIYFES